MFELIQNATRHLFFTGKGGVGKTSMACATAVQLAQSGKRVLLVSTDPASNLDEVLGCRLGHTPTPVDGVDGLDGINIDPQIAAAEYRERMVQPYRGVLPDAAVRSMEEQFSGSCTVEIAAFDEFAKLLGDDTATSDYDHVVFDTAPTGHTLRLLTLPSAWSGFMESSTTGASCLGPLAGLQAQQAIYKKTVAALGNGDQTTLVLVTRPETSAFAEAARSSDELRQLGVLNQRLIVNGVFTASDEGDRVAAAMQKRGDHALEQIPSNLAELPRLSVALSPSGVMGIDRLRQVGRADHEASGANTGSPLNVSPSSTELPGDLSDLVDGIAAKGRGVVLAMGKGGVGKTTVASAVAVALARRGFDVHLSTTDPAAHVAATLASESLERLTVDRIDPAAEVEAYRAEVLATAGENLDANGRALLEEDLRSPCTEEIAVFRAFAQSVAAGTDRFVVLDTAPTGHTILLLDSAMAYHREVSRQGSEVPESVQQLLPRLRDPDFTQVLIVTLPEATPVHEAAKLQEDLVRAGIQPTAWVINQSIAPLETTDPALQRRQSHEQAYIDEVKTLSGGSAALVPWQLQPPTGVDALSKLGQRHHAPLESRS
ncbi:arsenical pump-driving ATPase [Crateriforma conspicua]|uniref:arsenite-transporting ATPase n=1 Tax=Crateriforma conspicua TaxID=2527996 RepID=A0A5C5Y187_9PLAN|nr:arsenical pump-driving ATPase [Crateriforma conspicua]TWT68413.1 Arsenical pump-driving ATPase [Crateriforma conspicua]